MATSPALGYGNRSEVNIDTYNQWQRSQPWYQQLIRSFGQDPNNVHLDDNQKQQVIRAAQANGVVVDEGGDGQEVDDSGNFRAKGHKLRNTLIVAGLAGAALATAGAAGLFGGAAAGGAGAAEGSAAGLAGIEGGAAGLSDAALAGLGTGAMGAVPVAGAAGAAGGAFDAAGNFIGDSTFGSTAAGGGGILGAAKGLSGLAPDILGTIGAVGSSLGAAGKGAADARVTEAGINQRQDALSLQRYTDSLQGANTDLAQRKFALTAPAQRESNAVRGDILSSAKDFSYGAPTMVGHIPVPTSSGGLRPSIFSNDTKQLGSTIARQQNQAQQSGDVFSPLPTIPNLTPLPSAGAGDSILNTAGTVGNISDLLSKLPYGKLTSLFGRNG